MESMILERTRSRKPAPQRRPSRTDKNVNGVERIASALLGSALLARGMTNMSFGGIARTLVAGELIYRGVTGTCPLYKAAGIRTAGASWTDAGAPPDAHEVERSITIGRSREELYQLWLAPGTLSRVMSDLGEVTTFDGHSRWRIHGPMGKTLEWDSRIVRDRYGESIGWRSLPGSRLPNEGSVEFRPAPDPHGTEVILRFRFDPPGGLVGDVIAKMLGIVPSTLAMKALRKFKSLAETGEVPTTEHNPSARRKARAA